LLVGTTPVIVPAPDIVPVPQVDNPLAVLIVAPALLLIV